MTNREVIKGWEEIFILLMEETDDPTYKRAEEIINTPNNQQELNHLIEEELPLGIVIGFYILLMILRAGNLEKLSTLNMEEMANRIDDFWNRYLRKATRSYTSKNGLPPVDSESLHVTCRVIKTDNLKDD